MKGRMFFILTIVFIAFSLCLGCESRKQKVESEVSLDSSPFLEIGFWTNDLIYLKQKVEVNFLWNHDLSRVCGVGDNVSKSQLQKMYAQWGVRKVYMNSVATDILLDEEKFHKLLVEEINLLLQDSNHRSYLRVVSLEKCKLEYPLKVLEYLVKKTDPDSELGEKIRSKIEEAENNR